jgi:phage terminase large subunit
MIDFRVIAKHFDVLDQLFADDTKDTLVSQGSSRSGKTFQISAYLILLALEVPGHRIAVCRYEQTVVRKTIWKDYMEVIDMLALGDDVVRINKSESTITFLETGSEIFFTGLNDPSKIRGLKSTIAHVDEAIDCPQESYDQLSQRCTGKMILSFNPSVTTHYILDVVKDLPSTLYIHSTYKDNPYLTPRIINKIESYNPLVAINIENGTADEYMWKVYGLGLPAGKEGTIYKHFKYISPADWPSSGTTVYGMDFGYGDPTTLVEITYYEDVYSARTLLYESDLCVVSPDPLDEKTIANRLAELDIPKSAPLICDNARPENVNSLRRLGYNASSCRKGPNSIIAGIEVVRSRPVNIVQNDNLQIEAEQYIWKTDTSGKPVVPYKPSGPDHALDALRYGMQAFGNQAVEYQPGTITRAAQLNRVNKRRREQRYNQNRRGNRYG